MTTRQWMAGWALAVMLLAGLARAAETDEADPIVVDPSLTVPVEAASDTQVIHRIESTPDNSIPPGAIITTSPETTSPEQVHVPPDAADHPWDEHWTDTTFDASFPSVWSHWTVNFDALFWRRSRPNGLTLGISPDPTVPAFDANQFSFDYESGPRLAIIRRGISGWDVELNYFGIEGWHSTLDMPNNVDSRLPGDDPGGEFVSDLFFVVPGLTIDYQSTVHSEELNLRHAINETWTGLIGFRALQVHERYDTFDGVFGLPFYSITAENRLYGFQLGGEGRVFGTERLGVMAVAKAGLYENNTEQATTDFSGLLAGVSSTVLAASHNQASFVGELGIVGIFRVTETIFIRAGYNIMWIDDVALAPKQIPVNEFATFLPEIPLEAVDAEARLILHGATVGVELTW